MVHKNTLEHCWCSTVEGYSIVVEEHVSDLSYIVEFYDARELGDEHCVSFLPTREDPLSIEMLQHRNAA